MMLNLLCHFIWLDLFQYTYLKLTWNQDNERAKEYKKEVIRWLKIMIDIAKGETELSHDIPTVVIRLSAPLE